MAVVYVLTARLSQLFAVSVGPGNVTPVWLPSGLLLAWALRRGPWIWPGVFLGAGFGNAWTYFDASHWAVAARALAAGGMNGLGDTLSIVGGAWLFIRFGDRHVRLVGPRAARVFIVGSCVGATLLSALFGVGGLWAFGFTTAADAQLLLSTWWVGDGVGALLIAPFILAWTAPRQVALAPHTGEAWAMTMAGAAVLVGEGFVVEFRELGGAGLLMLLVTFWAAVRLPARYTFTGVLAAVAGNILITASQATDERAMVRLQIFMGVLGVTAVGVTSLANLVRRLNRQLVARLEAGDAELALRGAAIEAAASAIAVVDPDGALRWGNPAWQSLAGEGRSPAPDELADWRRLRPGEQREAMVVHRRADGDAVTVEQTVTALGDGAGGVRAFVVVEEDVSPFLANEARLSHLAHHDPLTGLLNRAGLLAAIEGALGGRAPAHLALLLLDLDRFKDINDALGHAAGDAVLMAVAHRLQALVREGDGVARLGGDEFAVLQRDVDVPEDVGGLARRILVALAEPVSWRGHQIRCGASVGVALGPDARESPLSLLERADVALYDVKERGRGDFAFHDDRMTQAVRARLALVTEIEAALANDGLTLRWQPQWRLADGVLVGLEVLFELTAAPHTPMAHVMKAAERAGLMPQLGEALMEAALGVLVAHRAAGRAMPRIGVNVSPVEVRAAGYAHRLLDRLARHNLKGRVLTLELTESALLGDVPQVVGAISALHAAGVALAIDDFGTGHSSLAMVGELPMHQIKIDRRFVGRMADTPESEAIVRAAVRMAHALGLQTVAEGVETLAQLKRLKAVGCDAGQGTLLGRPLDEAGLLRLLERPEWPMGASDL
ncbi:MAG: EAL domain-containing protein [Myxococcales bacterium]|nr:EAL domain-containing protein [Myxococcales bacterium]